MMRLYWPKEQGALDHRRQLEGAAGQRQLTLLAIEGNVATTVTWSCSFKTAKDMKLKPITHKLLPRALPALPLFAQAGGLYMYEIGTADIGFTGAGTAARAEDASTVYASPPA